MILSGILPVLPCCKWAKANTVCALQKDEWILGMFNSLMLKYTGHVAYGKKEKARL